MRVSVPVSPTVQTNTGAGCTSKPAGSKDTTKDQPGAAVSVDRQTCSVESEFQTNNDTRTPAATTLHKCILQFAYRAASKGTLPTFVANTAPVTRATPGAVRKEQCCSQRVACCMHHCCMPQAANLHTIYKHALNAAAASKTKALLQTENTCSNSCSKGTRYTCILQH